MGLFNFDFGLGIGFILIVDLAFAYHIIRSGRSPLWVMVVGFLGPLGWIAYTLFALLPDMANSNSARRLTDGMVSAADPGRAYREKKRQVEQVGSMDAKRALAEESVKRGLYDEAISLYESAMQGPIGATDPVLMKGLARARMLSGDGAGAEQLFRQMRAADPAAFDSDAELDFARALALEGKNDEALRQYEQVVARYPGEEARAHFALFLESLGQEDRAQALFREILQSVKGAPGYYKRRQREFIAIARQHIR